MVARKFHQTVTIGLITVLAILSIHYNANASDVLFPKATLTIAAKPPQTFHIEIAQTSEQQERGLMFRKTLGENEGMLFPFNPPRVVSMWMKNTLIPLDMLFIDGTNTIVHIHENAQPESEEIISYPATIHAVLELKAGTCKKYHIQIGDKISHDAFLSPTNN